MGNMNGKRKSKNNNSSSTSSAADNSKKSLLPKDVQATLLSGVTEGYGDGFLDLSRK